MNTLYVGTIRHWINARPQVLYDGVLYLAINFADGYLLTPLLQRRAVSLPPALLLAAVALVLVKMLYIGDLADTPPGSPCASESARPP